jgi:photosystem II stability/assembly factor-like uncharacterized protein
VRLAAPHGLTLVAASLALMLAVVPVPALAVVPVLAGGGPAASAAIKGPGVLLRQAAPVAAHPERVMMMAVTRAGGRLVAVGVHGCVALSDDMGVSWRAASVPVDVTLTGVRFADARIGWAIGHLGTVLRTDDGGEHWRLQLDGFAAAALATAQAIDAPQRDAARRLVDDGPDKPWLDMLVHDASRINVIGAFNLAFDSSDGGTNWQWASARFANPRGLHLYGIATSGALSMAVGEQGLVLVARGGDAYAQASSPYEGSFFGIVALPGGAFLAHGMRGNAFVTHDAGRTWAQASLAGVGVGAGASINAALVLTDGSVVLGDQSGRVYRSVDGARHFARLPYNGAPVTGLVEAPDGALVVVGWGGVGRLPLPSDKRAYDTQQRKVVSK